MSVDEVVDGQVGIGVTEPVTVSVRPWCHSRHSAAWPVSMSHLLQVLSNEIACPPT